jgi:hypothetical protein
MYTNNDVLHLLRLCVASCSYDTAYIWRAPVSITFETNVVHRDTPTPIPTPIPTPTPTPIPTPSPMDKHPLRFCLHTRTCSTVAGTMCNECGVVVNQVHASVDVSHSRPPVYAAFGKFSTSVFIPPTHVTVV